VNNKLHKCDYVEKGCVNTEIITKKVPIRKRVQKQYKKGYTRWGQSRYWTWKTTGHNKVKKHYTRKGTMLFQLKTGSYGGYNILKVCPDCWPRAIQEIQDLPSIDFQYTTTMKEFASGEE